MVKENNGRASRLVSLVQAAASFGLLACAISTPPAVSAVETSTSSQVSVKQSQAAANSLESTASKLMLQPTESNPHATVPFPIGESVFARGHLFSFNCPSGITKYSIEVVVKGALFATSPARAPNVQNNLPGICSIAFEGKKVLGKPTQDIIIPFFNAGFPLDTEISWRARASSGVATDRYEFITRSVLYETFEGSHGLFQFTDNNWHVSDGMLSISSATPNSLAFVELPVNPQPRLPSESRLFRRGYLTTFRFSSFCSQPRCEVGLIGLMDTPPSEKDLPVRWYEVTIQDDVSAFLSYRETVSKPGTVTINVLKNLKWDSTPQDHTVRFWESVGHLRIEIDGKTEACLYLPKHSGYHMIGSRPGAGIRWQSLDDDNDVNSLRMDWLHVQVQPVPDWRCEAALPPLPEPK